MIDNDPIMNDDLTVVQMKEAERQFSRVLEMTTNLIQYFANGGMSEHMVELGRTSLEDLHDEEKKEGVKYTDVEIKALRVALQSMDLVSDFLNWVIDGRDRAAALHLAKASDNGE